MGKEFDINNLITEDKKKIKDSSRGRPKKSGEKCDQPVNAYFTSSEVENLKAAAEKLGMSVSSYLRYLFLKEKN